MTFFVVHDQEMSALMGLPYLQQMTYLMGIKPYMDRQTAMVGIKRRISYQSIAEALYIEPHPGIASGSPSRQHLRRSIKGLERAGLIQIYSDEKHLMLKCLFAPENNAVQNKPDTNPTHQSDTKPYEKKYLLSEHYDRLNEIPNTAQKAKADTPHQSINNIGFVLLLTFRSKKMINFK